MLHALYHCCIVTLNIKSIRRASTMGTIINAMAILVGGTLGLLFRKRFPERVAQTTLQVLGLFTLVIGLSMAIQGHKLTRETLCEAAESYFGDASLRDERSDR